MARTLGLLGIPLALVLACGDDRPSTGEGSGEGSSGSRGSSSSGDGATSLVTTTDASSTGTSGSSTSVLDGTTTTGGEVLLCDACAESDVCVLDYYEKSCISCDDLLRLPLDVVCVSKVSSACDETFTHTRACALELCGSPYASEYGCECGEQGDFICGVGPAGPANCDYWDHAKICDPGSKCVPARDEQGQPLPYTECIQPAVEPLPLGAPCMTELWEDECEETAYCDEVDPDTGTGTCRALCVGTEAVPSCDELGESCVLFVEDLPQFGGVCRPA